MKYGNLIIEKKEYVYLKRILNISGYAEDFETQKSLQRLSDELKSASILSEEEMPEDVVRFNSKVLVSSETGWKTTLQVVIPADRDMDKSKISILTPMGAALFGYAETDNVSWDFPRGKQQLKINKVSQDAHAPKIDVPL